jgi:hypothetical protein
LFLVVKRDEEDNPSILSLQLMDKVFQKVITFKHETIPEGFKGAVRRSCNSKNSLGIEDFNFKVF